MLTTIVFAIAGSVALSQGPDTTLLNAVAQRGREFAQRAAPTTRAVPAAQQQYRIALALLDSAKWDDAAVRLQAVSRIDSRNAQYKGDLGFVLLRLSRWDDAAAAYQGATQIQSTNPWYYVGLALARAEQQRFLEASGMMALAASTDSVVVTRQFIEAILNYYERAGRAANGADWYRIGTARFPDVAVWWLRLAQQMREQGDTTNGIAAARRYVQLAPTEPLGLATLAGFLYDVGQNDSAVLLASRVASDTSFRPFVGQIYLGVGTRAFRVRDWTRASTVLRQGQTVSGPELATRFAYYLGFADLQRVVTLLQAADQARDCPSAQAADSLLTLAERNLRTAVALDSANVTQTLTTSMPQARTAAQNMIRGYCPATPARRRN
jgi:tetratricopeptide (TPR) repeat protein